MSSDEKEGAESVDQRRKPTPRHYAEYSLYLVVAWLARFLGERNLGRLAGFMAAISGRVVERRTRLATRNLELTMPELTTAERKKTVDRCWKHFVRMSLDYVRTSSIPFNAIASEFEVIGRENMERAVASGKAVLLVSAHFGAWENALSVAAQFGRKVTVVGRRLDNPLLHRRIYEGRTRGGITLLDRRVATRGLVSAIGEKEIIVLLVDQAVQPSQGEIIPFMGHPAWTTVGPARLAVKYDLPIVPVFTYPSDGGRKPRLEFEPMIVPSEAPDASRTPAGIMTLLNERISARIRRDPHLWLWFHDRWKGIDEKN
ncbi:MAG: lysophospholipid acyltransferase family protein [Thermoanaerobaculia bacterium]|jgi:KDO2-lipid IV(A) lauroyltransferase